MKWASTLSLRPPVADAFSEAAEGVERQLGSSAPNLLLTFVSAEHVDGCARIAAMAARRFPGALLVGCTAGGVIGGAHEAEEGPALSLTAAVLPGTALSAFHVDAGPLARAGGSSLRARAGGADDSPPKILLLADPFTADVGRIIEELDAAYPGAPKFGGLASGGRAAGENRLLAADEVHDGGAVGIAFRGDVEVDTVIAQGCRAIGEPMIVTRCRENVLLELDGQPPLAVLAELYAGLDARDRELMQHSLFVGLEMRAASPELAPPDLLVRNIVGADEATGALAVGAELRPMMVAQFALRDAHSAEQDLQRMLDRQRRAAGRRPAGALLFSCVGRGAGLFGARDHDTSLFEEQLGPAPLGGFFCNGEIGPVGGTTFLHGYTSAFAIFRPPGASVGA
jgi:small ligand-binding sensory domain FIST